MDATEKMTNNDELKAPVKWSVSGYFNSLPLAWRSAIIVFLVVRILASASAIISYKTVPSNPIAAADGYSKQAYPRYFELLFGVWERSDVLWYIKIAKSGYGENKQGAAFLPLYPLTIKGVRILTGLPWLVCAILVSNLALLCALAFLFRLTEMEKDSETASKTIWYLALFPGSIFMLVPYTESLFLALATGAFLAARNRKWLPACILSAFLGATRNLGFLIILPLFIEFIRQRKEEPPVQSKQGFWLFLTPLGLLSVLFFWNIKTGDPLAIIHQQNVWGRHFTWPWMTVLEGIRQAYIFMNAPVGGLYLAEAVVVLCSIFLGIIAIRKVPAPYTVFLWLCFLPPLFAPFDGRMFMCYLRFVSVIFPLFMTLATEVRNSDLDLGIKIVFAGLFGLSTALYVSSLSFF